MWAVFYSAESSKIFTTLVVEGFHFCRTAPISTKNHIFFKFPAPVKKTSESKVLLIWCFVNTYCYDNFSAIGIKNIQNKYFLLLKSNKCNFGVNKSTMVPKIQDSGQIFLCLLTKKLDIALKNSHTKIGACWQSVIGPIVSACTTRTECWNFNAFKLNFFCHSTASGRRAGRRSRCCGGVLPLAVFDTW